MTMISKFAGKCTACGSYMPAGTTIDWAKGAGAKHAIAAQCVQQPAAAAVPAPVVNAAPIVAFLNAARDRGLKFPKVRMLAADGQRELRLQLAGAGSKYPGAVQVTLQGEWIGRILPDGHVAGPLAQASHAAHVPHLQAIAADPAAAAKAYAALFCRCSFCGLELTDAGSVEVGYGPICAAKFGLPHTAKGTPKLTPAAA